MALSDIAFWTIRNINRGIICERRAILQLAIKQIPAQHLHPSKLSSSTVPLLQRSTSFEAFEVRASMGYIKSIRPSIHPSKAQIFFQAPKQERTDHSKRHLLGKFIRYAIRACACEY